MGDYQVSTTNVELELRSPTLKSHIGESHTIFWDWVDPDGILPKSLWEWFHHVFLLLCVFHSVNR